MNDLTKFIVFRYNLHTIYRQQKQYFHSCLTVSFHHSRIMRFNIPPCQSRP